jgi:phosphohistidine phosphatase
VIWLLRHAEAEDGTPDEERPLTSNGEQDARAAGLALARLGVEVDGCVSSPKLRAVDTARLACEPFGVEPTVDERLAGGPFDPREVAGDLGDNVLLVGHDPDFSLAINHMTGAQVRLKKASLAGVDRGELKALLRPSELKALAAST